MGFEGENDLSRKSIDVDRRSRWCLVVSIQIPFRIAHKGVRH